MNTDTKSSQTIYPYKSVAVALLFCVFLGPVGLLYSSFWWAILFILIGFYCACHFLLVLLGLSWLICCILGVRGVEKYNKKIITHKIPT